MKGQNSKKMKTYTQEELKTILELHLKWLRNEEGGIRANLRGANLSSANLSSANLRGADLRGAIKVPMYCKWTHGITDGLIHIGCEKRSVEEWDEFFASDNVIQTQRNTDEFKQIQAIFNAYKAYLETFKQQEQ